MAFTFQKPIGAYADVKELEYIAALHQTKDDDRESFVDGSIEAIDVKHFLCSRYGIRVTEDEVKRFIFYDLAGGDGTSDCIDLTEVVSMLIIPYLVKVTCINARTAEDHRESHLSGFEQEALLMQQRLREDVNESIIEDMLNIIMTETTGSREPRPLTKELLHEIFMQYNEHDLIEDDALLDEMIDIASEGALGTELLDVSSFTRGLTSDIKLYNPYNETKFTTHYEDVFGMVTSKKETKTSATHQVHEVVDQDEEKELTDESADTTIQVSLCTGTYESANEALESPPNDREIYSLENITILKNSTLSVIAEEGTVCNEGCGEEEQDRRVFTFSQIDSMADTFRRRIHFILVWLAAIFGYLAYLNPLLNPLDREVLCSAEHKDTLRCKTANSIVLWLRIMGTMFAFVAPSVMILSLGNDIQNHSVTEIAGGMSGIAFLIFFPIWYKNIDLGEELGFSTKEDAENGMWTATARKINLSIGILLLIVQIFNIIRVVVPDGKLQKSKILTLILRGSGVRSEFGIKNSSAAKVHKMVKNAYTLHPMIAETKSNSKKTTAMLNYNNESEKSERTGGFLWAWRRYLNGELLDREGIWTHSRLQVAYVTQLILSVMVPLVILYFANHLADDMYDKWFGRISNELPLVARETYNDECSSHFDPASCYFPSVNGTSLGLGFCEGVTLECATSNSDQKLNTFLNKYVAKLDGIGETIYCMYLKQYGYLPLDEPCPDLWYPTEPISTNTTDSDATSSCNSIITLCLEPTGDPLTSVCIIGSRNFINFQFKDVGSGCLNHAVHSFFGVNGFKLLLESDRMEDDEVNARENKTISIEEQLNDAYDMAYEFQNKVVSWIPPRHFVRISLIVGSSCALIAGVANSLVNIPSQVLTALQFRSGSAKSLRDPRFVTYRHGILSTSYLIGVAIWSSIFMIILVLIVVSFVVFLVLFERTQAALFTFFSMAIGICATLFIRLIAFFFLEMYCYEGFYRKHPLVANISNVCFECWHLTLSSGFVLARIGKLFGILLLYIGRYDQPILAEGVGEIGLKSLDSFPHIFKVDLLAIEAHRHPYIERLGMMYMMKLRHGRHFGKRAGSVWRLLFVTALMPWLRKHRIVEQDEEE